MGESNHICLILLRMRGRIDHRRVRVNAFICALNVPPRLRVFRSLFVLQKHVSWYSVEKLSHCANTFNIVTAKGLSVMDILFLLVASDDEGILERSEMVIPPVSHDVVEGQIPISFSPLMIVYHISDDHEPEKTVNVAADILWVQAHLSFFDHGLVDIAHEYSYLRSKVGQGHKETMVRVIAEKEKSFHTWKVNEAEGPQCHDEEVDGFKGRIFELEVAVKHVTDDFVMTAESNSDNYARTVYYKAEKEKHIRKKVPEFLEAGSKLDKDVAVKVANKEDLLCTKSWPYLLEIVTSKDEDIDNLLPI
uniref:Uncharacterized protein n=1 Tax=Tanacetum cinerariifolium TaxID=118510 RepID=A0A6L2J1R9_TANCI|nr:hypothetical protein [Tanacetum cinerariifolium]